jgi:hypothetical protein
MGIVRVVATVGRRKREMIVVLGQSLLSPKPMLFFRLLYHLFTLLALAGVKNSAF